MRAVAWLGQPASLGPRAPRAHARSVRRLARTRWHAHVNATAAAAAALARVVFGPKLHARATAASTATTPAAPRPSAVRARRARLNCHGTSGGDGDDAGVGCVVDGGGSDVAEGGGGGAFPTIGSE